MTKPVYVSDSTLNPDILVMTCGKDHRPFAYHKSLHNYCKGNPDLEVKVLHIEHSMIRADVMNPLSVNDMPAVRLERLKACIPNYEIVTFGLDLNFASQYNMQTISHLYSHLCEGKRVRVVITSNNILRTVKDSFPEDVFQMQDFLLDSGIEFR